MIEHADAAVRDWLADVVDVAGVDIDAGSSASASGTTSSGASRLRLQLVGIDERVDRRTTASDDVRDDAGRVQARQPATRFFELDYACSPTGDVTSTHRVLGELLQLLISVDVVPRAFVPEELAALGIPIEVGLTPSAAAHAVLDRLAVGTAPVLLRVVLPMQPTPETVIGKPAEHFHLDVGPPPESSRASGPSVVTNAGAATGMLLADRRWTTVRRREFIGGSIPEPADDETTGSGAPPRSRKSKR